MDVMKKIPGPKTEFLRVKCKGCSSEQIIFSAANTIVKCKKCNQVLAEPTGSKAKIVNVLETNKLL